MGRSFSPSERRRLNDAARDYQRSGYRVIKEPEASDVPDFLRGLRPDMLAYGEHENVVVQVKSSDTLSQARDLVPLAEAVHEQPNWRLELRVVGVPRERSALLLSRWEIRHRLADARELIERQEDAAFLLAYTAAEAAMRLIAQRNGVRLGRNGRDTAAHILEQLVSLGLVGRDDYRSIEEGARLGSLLVRGYRVQESIPAVTERLIGGVEHLLAEVPEQIAS